MSIPVSRLLRLTALMLVVSVLSLAGCATSGPQGQFAFDNNHPDRVWPAPPEIPRFRYVGELTGERNFHQDAATRSAWASVVDFITGIGDDAEELRLLRPQGLMVDDRGNIVVTDVGRRAVFYFDVTAGHLQVWKRIDGESRFIAPVGVAQGANGEILVTDAELGYVVRLNRKGEVVGRFGKGELQRPTGITRNRRTGHVFVADTRADDIKVFDATGKRLATLGRSGTGPGEFNAPTYLDFANGKLYVADTLNSRIQILEPDGIPVRQIGRNGLYVGNMNRPKGIAADSRGNIYIIESYRDYLLIYNEQGEFLLPIGGTGNAVGNFYLPAGISIDSHDRIYIADMFNGRVVVLQSLSKE